MAQSHNSSSQSKVRQTRVEGDTPDVISVHVLLRAAVDDPVCELPPAAPTQHHPCKQGGGHVTQTDDGQKKGAGQEGRKGERSENA